MRPTGSYRVGVFLDYSNVLKDASRAFGLDYEALLARLSPGRLGVEALRVSYRARRANAILAFVEVHIALENPWSAEHIELVSQWCNDDVAEVVAYVRHRRPGREVGVDTACALSCAHAVLDNPPRCEAVLLFSADLDLRPVTEVIGREGPPDAVKTLSWYVPGGWRVAMPKDGERRGACGNVRLPRSVLEASLRDGALN